MAIVMTEGFDMYNGTGANTGLQAKWTIGAGSPSLVTGRFGGQALRTTQQASGLHVVRALPSTYNAFAHGTAFRAVSLPLVSTIGSCCAYESGGTIQFGWQVDNLGALRVYRYSSLFAGTLLGTSANGLIAANTWYFIECEALISATVGTVTLYIDGTAVLTLTGLNNKNAGTTTMDSIRFGGGGAYSSAWNQDVDDNYVRDTNTKLGPCKIETLRPDADTAQKDFTPNSGTANFSRVNETLVDGDTSYVQATTVGNRDLYTLGDLSSVPASVFALNICSFAEKTDAATRTIYNSVQSNATDSDGTAFNLAASYSRFDRIMETDPSGGGAWTASRVNALLVGPKVAS